MVSKYQEYVLGAAGGQLSESLCVGLEAMVSVTKTSELRDGILFDGHRRPLTGDLNFVLADGKAGIVRSVEAVFAWLSLRNLGGIPSAARRIDNRLHILSFFRQNLLSGYYFLAPTNGTSKLSSSRS
jgi:hypothetical protein